MVIYRVKYNNSFKFRTSKAFLYNKGDIIVFVLSGGQEYNEEFNFGPSHFAL